MNSTTSSEQDARAAYDSGMQKLKRSQALCAALWSAFAVCFTIGCLSGKNPIRYKTGFLLLPAAGLMIAAICFSVRNKKQHRAIRKYLPQSVPDDAQAAIDHSAQILHETKDRFVLSCWMLIPAVAMFIAVILLSERNPFPPILCGMIILLVLCTFSFTYTMPTLGRIRKDACYQAELCAESVYRAAVHEIYGEDAAFDSIGMSEKKAPAPFANADGAEYWHRIGMTRGKSRIALCDAYIERSGNQDDQTVVLLRGILTEISTGRRFDQDFVAMRRGSINKRAAEQAGKQLSVPFEAVYDVKKKDRAACDSVLTDRMKEALAASPVNRIGIYKDGRVCYGINGLYLFPKQPCDLQRSLEQFRAVTALINPVVDCFAALSGPAAPVEKS